MELHDGSTVILKKLDQDYNPTDRFAALRVLEEGQQKNWLVTGLLYVDPEKPSLTELYDLVDKPLNRLEEADLRPAPEMIKTVNDLMF